MPDLNDIQSRCDLLYVDVSARNFQLSSDLSRKITGAMPNLIQSHAIKDQWGGRHSDAALRFCDVSASVFIMLLRRARSSSVKPLA